MAQQVTQKQELIKNYTADLAKLVIKGSEAQARRHAELNQFAQDLTTKVQTYQAQRRIFVTMQDEVSNMRSTKAPEMLRQIQARYPASGLGPAQWDNFLLIYKGDVDKALRDYIAWADQEFAKIQGGVPPPPGDANAPLIADTEDLSQIQLARLKAEITRLEQIIGADTAVRQQYNALSTHISQENVALKWSPGFVHLQKSFCR